MQETFFLNFKTRGTQRSEVVVALGASENCVVETHRINEHLSNWPCIVTFEIVVLCCQALMLSLCGKRSVCTTLKHWAISLPSFIRAYSRHCLWHSYFEYVKHIFKIPMQEPEFVCPA